MLGRVLKNLQVILGSKPFVAAFAEAIISEPEPRRRKEIVAVGVLGKRAGLADQRIHDVAIMHRVLVATHQSRQRIDMLVRVPNLDAVGEKPRFDLFADQSAVHRVRVAMNMNQTPGVHATRHFQAR